MSKARELADLGSVTDKLEEVGNTDGSLSNRNLIINGAMQVAQRGTSVTGVTSSGYYTCDRWVSSVATGTFTATQGTSGPTGFPNTLKLECTTASASAANILLEQRIEGYNLQGLGFGTSDAKPLTLSFWVKSNVVGNYTTEFYNNDSARQVSKVFSVDASDVWEKKTLNIPADTSNGFGNDAGLSLYVLFWLNAATTFTSGTQNTTAWTAAVNSNRVNSDIVNIASTVGNYFQITGVQLEVGDTATPFEHRSYGDELARCQRYFQVIGSTSNNFVAVTGSSGSYTTVPLIFPVKMRAAPSSAFDAQPSGSYAGGTKDNALYLSANQGTMIGPMQVKLDAEL